MRPVYQTHFEENGTGPGNCMQASVASLLNLNLGDVPNFVVEKDPFAVLTQYMQTKGYRLERMHPNFAPWGNYLITGTSTRGHEHMVVYNNGRLLFDPNPNGKPGLVSEHDVYWPIPLTRKAAEVLQ